MSTNRGTVLNKSRVQVEPACRVSCPRCRGHGRTTADREHACAVCGGEGDVWQSESGWTRRIGARLEQSTLY